MVKTLINLMKYFSVNDYKMFSHTNWQHYFFRYCPDCRKNQCATKTLTVWRFPDFLILYLKRYIQNHFHLKHYLIVIFTYSEFQFTIVFFYFQRRFIFMGNDGTYADGNLNGAPGGTAIKLNKDVEFKVIF